MITFSLAVIFFFGCFHIFLLSRNKSNLPPGPWNLPIIGYLPMLDPQKPYLTLMKLSQKYGPIFTIKLGVMKTVVISDAKILRKVLMKDEALDRPPLFLIDYLCKGKGITYATGELWKDQRKLVSNFLRSITKITPNRNILEGRLNEYIDEFIDNVKNQGDVVKLDPLEGLTHFIGNISGGLFLGKKLANGDDFCDKLIHQVNEVAKQAAFGGALNFIPFLRFLPVFRKYISSFNKTIAYFYSNQQKHIEDCKNSFAEDGDGVFNLIDTFFSQTTKFNEKMYSMDQLIILLGDMFGASTETTISSISWVILHLAAYPKVQDKVREEITNVVQNRRPKIDDVANLPYTEATIAEIGRFNTVIPLGVPRYTVQDLHIENCTIPKNTMIMPLLWAIHMDPKVWQNPEEFCPDRFLDQDGKFCQPESYLPFQTGKRVCLGEDLAKIIVFLFTANLVQNFKIESCNPVDFSAVCGITLVPKAQKLIFRKL